MANDLIAKARQRYLAEHPLHIKEFATVITSTGEPSDPFRFPDLEDTQIIGCKLGMEFLAICHDDELVNDWINTCMSIAKEPDWAAILFANVFRGMNTVIAAVMDRPGVREHLERQAVDAWTRDFSEGFDA